LTILSLTADTHFVHNPIEKPSKIPLIDNSKISHGIFIDIANQLKNGLVSSPKSCGSSMFRAKTEADF